MPLLQEAPVLVRARWRGFLACSIGMIEQFRAGSARPSHVCCLFGAILVFAGCGAKGDPKPPQRFAPSACAVRAIDPRTVEVVLPKTDVQGNSISGVEAVKIYYLSLGNKFPSSMEVFAKGEPILERRRQDLPSPGNAVRLSLSNFGRPAGWLVVVPFRAGNVAGEPSAVLAWLDPAF